MKIKFVKAYGNYDAGELADLDEEQVVFLLKEECCELCDGEKLTPKPKPRRKPAPKKK